MNPLSQNPTLPLSKGGKGKKEDESRELNDQLAEASFKAENRMRCLMGKPYNIISGFLDIQEVKR